MSHHRDALLEEIKNKAVVHGKVVLSSGLESDYYIDLRRITLDGVAAPLVGQVMLDLAAELDFDAVGGLTLVAILDAASFLIAAALIAASTFSTLCAPFSGISETGMTSCSAPLRRRCTVPCRTNAPCSTSRLRLNQKTFALVFAAISTQVGSSALRTAKSSPC